MKILFSMIVGVLVLSSSAFSAQHFNCRPMPVDPMLSDRAIIALMTESEGTLFLTSGLDDFGNQDSTGPLKIIKTAQTESEMILEGTNTTSQFKVVIPFSAIGKNSDQVFLKLEAVNKQANLNQDLDCFTRVY